MARVLVACEYSGRVREAFRAAGHDAWICDLLPAEDGSKFHFHGDVRNWLHGDPELTHGYSDAIGLFRTGRGQWDLLIAHPPCTYLTRAGARWWPGRKQEQADALAFVRMLLAAPIPRIALENPPGRIGTEIRPADQYVQPWQFGHPETKGTGLWLVGLPKLQPTVDVHAEMLTLPMKERSRVHYMAPGPDRWKERSRTYKGIATAMAQQWGALLPSNDRHKRETPHAET